MLKRTPDREIAGATTPDVPPAAIAAALAAVDGDRLFVAEDEQRAAAVAALAAAFVPNRVVVHLPASDALPDDVAPASPANVGQRVAALHRLRLASVEHAAPILLVLSAEASAYRYAAPEGFDTAPPVVSIGDAVDADGFAAMAADLGYVADDRVDEPGEVAVRGGVIDIFPADRERPVRIEIEDGAIVALRSYDPATQLSDGDAGIVTIGRAAEPDLGRGVPITGHLPGATLSLDAGAARQRDRFLAIAADGASRGRRAAALVDEAEWTAGIGPIEALETDDGVAPPRFVEDRAPLKAFARVAKACLADGRLLIAGSARDLRFLAPRLGIDTVHVASFREAAALPVGGVATLVAPVDRGFVHAGLTVVAAGDLLGSRARIGDGAAPAIATMLGTGDLCVGDVIVHEEFGIALVVGLETATGDGCDGDMIVLEHAKGSRRLVPVADAARIWRYGADRDAVSLDTLDGASWIKRRAAIDAAIVESAKALTALAAERESLTAEPIVPDSAAYERFAAGFPFTETADQARAIAAVRADLASTTPMERLVVGDVGYGKTEVALRAAALVAFAGRQVALVAPTTVLARQHFDTMRKRFEGTGIEVAGLSRVTGAAERKRVKAGLADGSIKVVVGTATVGGKGMAFADLALVVIDEEQRFGAAEKAKLRALGAGHTLTLSATPIPRTLQSAMLGLQSISVIATPPARRQPIRTTIAPFDEATVRKALLRERARDGQSFLVVPRIEDIEPLRAILARIVPELGLTVAHGKMPADELDEAMVSFSAGDGDVLLATNIIEAGLDVPRANTMIVHHADRFGLSQLHQLRGRVGRGGRRGQILLTTDGEATIAEATLKRLRTLQALDQLGAGFAISARDLDMRGAGDLIGEEQAGHMKLIGIDLYQHLLAQALREARGDTQDRWAPTLATGAGGGLPEAWIPEVDVRLSIYRRIAHLEDVVELDALRAELEDRFGQMPADALALIGNARTTMLARAAGIRQVDAGPGAIAFTPHDPKAALPDPFERANGRWIVRERIEDPAARAERIDDLLLDLADRAGA